MAEAEGLELQVLSFNDFHGHLQPPGGTDATLGATLDPSATPRSAVRSTWRRR